MKIKSIKNKLVLIIIFTSISAVLLSNIISLFFTVEMIEQSILRKMKVTASIVSNMSATSLVFNDKIAANEILSSLHSEKDIEIACLYTPNYQILSKYQRDNLIKDDCQLDFKTGYFINGANFRTFQDIFDNDGVKTGSLYIKAKIEELDKIIYNAIILTILILIAIVVFILIISFKLHPLVTKPILELATTASKVSTLNDFSLRAIKRSDDEIGLLVTTFNKMLSMIEMRDKELNSRNLELIYAKDIAEEANRSKSQFLANMSHELRTPMHAILSFSSIGARRIETLEKAQLKEFFEDINSSGTRLLALLNNLLDLSKLEAGKFDFEFNNHSLREIINSALKELHPLVDNKNITVFFNDYDKFACVCDKGKIMQVVINILSNAIKFTAENKSIFIDISDYSHYQIKTGNEEKFIAAWKVKFSDQGIGIPDGELDKVFDKFIQSSKTKTGAGGTGLGLSICKEIIEAHKGKIWAENNKEESGAIFIFILPKEKVA